MATIPEIDARIHAVWAKGHARTLEESVELGRLLTELETEMPPGDSIRMCWMSSTFPHAPRSALCNSTASSPRLPLEKMRYIGNTSTVTYS
jgi:hypothetical protein